MFLGIAMTWTAESLMADTVETFLHFNLAAKLRKKKCMAPLNENIFIDMISIRMLLN